MFRSPLVRKGRNLLVPASALLVLATTGAWAPPVSIESAARTTRPRSVQPVVKPTIVRPSQEKPPAETTVEPPSLDALPLRGWTLIRDGAFDPESESVHDVLQSERVLGIAQTEDPRSFETGVIDIEGTLRKLAKRYPDGIKGYVELDWEEPFFEVLHTGPEHPRYQDTLRNVTRFVRRFKEVFPDAVVSHYNLPAIPYWAENESGRTVWWSQLEDSRREELLRELDAMRPLLDEMDWFAPRFYDFVPSGRIPERMRAEQIAAENEHRAEIVRWLRAYVDASDRPDRKILPVTRTNWVGGASDYRDWVEMEIPVQEYLDEQVLPALLNGADGIKMWQGWELWMLHLAFIPPDTIDEELLSKSHDHLRRLGILAPDEVPDWRSARQKREVARALGMRQMPYVSGVAGLMRSGLEPPVARPDDRDPDVREEPDDATKDAGKDRVRVIPADQTGRLRITHKPGKRRRTFRTPR